MICWFCITKDPCPYRQGFFILPWYYNQCIRVLVSWIRCGILVSHPSRQMTRITRLVIWISYHSVGQKSTSVEKLNLFICVFFNKYFFNFRFTNKIRMTYRDYKKYKNLINLAKEILLETLKSPTNESRGWIPNEPPYELKRLLRGYNVYYMSNHEGIWIHRHLPDLIG